MSYILDALRKSEQERQRGKVPDIHGGVSDSAEATRKANLWPIVTVAVVVLNLGILGYFWLSMPAAEAPALVTAPTSDTGSSPPPNAVVPEPAAAPKKQASKPQSSQPVAYSSNAETNRPVKPATPKTQPQTDPAYIGSDNATGSEPALPAVGYMPQLEELPAYERDGIPDMTFSSHMYSSMPRFRSIIINGKRLKEGQYLNEELQVREITESGVIMSFGNTLFEVDVLGRWAQ